MLMLASSAEAAAGAPTSELRKRNLPLFVEPPATPPSTPLHDARRLVERRDFPMVGALVATASSPPSLLPASANMLNRSPPSVAPRALVRSKAHMRAAVTCTRVT